MDRNKRIIYVNKKTEEVVGLPMSEMKGKECFNVIVGKRSMCEGCLIDDVITSKQSRTKIKHEVTAAGKEQWLLQLWYPVVDIEGNVDLIVEIARDISELKKTEEELSNARKLESLGMLAGGIAHDFNNLLTGILGCLSIAKELVKPEDKLFEVLVKAEGASMKAGNLTRQLISFAKREESDRKPSDVGRIVSEASEISLKNSNTRSVFAVQESLGKVEADEVQLKQVFVNLLTNAREAMPAGGVIKIGISGCEPSERPGVLADNREYLRVSIEDEGPGIPKAELRKVFDPYFSTKGKSTQKGSGLGLAIAYSIIKSHEGCITVSSDSSAGASFHVYLPIGA